MFCLCLQWSPSIRPGHPPLHSAIGRSGGCSSVRGKLLARPFPSRLLRYTLRLIKPAGKRVQRQKRSHIHDPRASGAEPTVRKPQVFTNLPHVQSSCVSPGYCLPPGNSQRPGSGGQGGTPAIRYFSVPPDHGGGDLQMWFLSMVRVLPAIYPLTQGARNRKANDPARPDTLWGVWGLFPGRSLTGV
jgi:hypothetical protein